MTARPFSPLRYFRNAIGWWRGYGGCRRCGDKWRWTTRHMTHYSGGGGCSPLCARCWTQLTPIQRVPFYRMTWEDWERDIPGHAGWDAIRVAVEAGL